MPNHRQDTIRTRTSDIAFGGCCIYTLKYTSCRLRFLSKLQKEISGCTFLDSTNTHESIARQTVIRQKEAEPDNRISTSASFTFLQ